MPYEDVMNVILPHRGNRSAHITGHYGEHRAKGPHGGSDFNYEGGQAGLNLTHPTIHSPVSGEVTFVGGQYGTIKIRDADGNSHEILHTQSQSVVVGQRLSAGDDIGQMGGRGPDGATQYAQHVHYQMKDSHGQPVNPEEFWNQRSVQHSADRAGTTLSHPTSSSGAHEMLRAGMQGTDVHALQETLNARGYADKKGKALHADGHFGKHTKEALEAFQHANGLKADGVAGPKTLEAMHHPKEASTLPRLDAASHPDHALYQQARHAVHRLDSEHRRPPDQHSDNLAAALTVAARREGMNRVDHAVLNPDASRTFAVQGDFNSPLKRVAEVETQQAVATPIEKSSEAWQQVMSKQGQAAQGQELQPPLPRPLTPTPGM